MAIGGFPEDRRVGEDTVVNTRLFELGYRAYFSAENRSVHKSPCEGPVKLLRHHFVRGRGFGLILWEQSGRPQRLRSRLRRILWLVTKYPAKRMRFITRAVRDWGETERGHFALSLPLILAGVASAALGALGFTLRPRPASGRASARVVVSQLRRGGS